jgi:transcriptional regulator with XRE-family HTH domain
MKRNNLTAVSVAKAVNISTAALSKYINDKTSVPKSDILLRLAVYFNVSMEYMLTGEDTKTENNGLNYISDKFNKLNKSDKEEIELMIDLKLKRYDNQSSYTSTGTENKVG